jgi:hypothetical protein
VPANGRLTTWVQPRLMCKNVHYVRGTENEAFVSSETNSRTVGFSRQNPPPRPTTSTPPPRHSSAVRAVRHPPANRMPGVGEKSRGKALPRRSGAGRETSTSRDGKMLREKVRCGEFKIQPSNTNSDKPSPAAPAMSGTTPGRLAMYKRVRPVTFRSTLLLLETAGSSLR